MSEYELSQAIEFVKDRLYYVTLKSLPRRTDAHFFTVDDTLVYWNFFLDFGPLNLGQLYRFCQMLNNKLHSSALSGKRIYFYSGPHAHKRTNAAFLITSYVMLYLNRTPEEAYRPFEGIQPPFPFFHDASPCVCTYHLSLLDVLHGIDAARRNKFFDFENFDIEEYEHFEKVENGDLNWLAAGKFIAFAGPHEVRSSTPEGYHSLCPDDYIPYFRKKNVTLVVRLNKKYYNETKFTRNGIDHLDLYYLDGSNPPKHLLARFLAACEGTPGAVAVHCKAGLGRTGTCIGAYMMKHYRMTAAEVIGWLRVCRPGSVIGPQQHFLKEIEAQMWADGDAFRRKADLSASSASIGRPMTPSTASTSGSPAAGGGSPSSVEDSKLDIPIAHMAALSLSNTSIGLSASGSSKDSARRAVGSGSLVSRSNTLAKSGLTVTRPTFSFSALQSPISAPAPAVAASSMSSRGPASARLPGVIDHQGDQLLLARDRARRGLGGRAT